MLQNKRKTSDFGRIGEDFAVNLLLKNGYKIIDRNFRGRFGEIDVVAEHLGALIFVEVKTRWSNKFGKPEEAVTPQKLRKIAKTAEYFSITHPSLSKKLRIEVVAIEAWNGKVISSRIIQVGA